MANKCPNCKLINFEEINDLLLIKTSDLKELVTGTRKVPVANLILKGCSNCGNVFF